jgi:hypothetical protein
MHPASGIENHDHSFLRITSSNVYAITYHAGAVHFNEDPFTNRIAFRVGFAIGYDQFNSVSLELPTHDRRALVQLLTAMPLGAVTVILLD